MRRYMLKAFDAMVCLGFLLYLSRVLWELPETMRGRIFTASATLLGRLVGWPG